MGKIIEKTQAIYERLISTGKIMINIFNYWGNKN